MKKNFDETIKDRKGVVVMDEGAPLTFAKLIVIALDKAPDYNSSLGEKRQRWELAERIEAGGIHEVTQEEIELIKRLVRTLYAVPFFEIGVEDFFMPIPPAPKAKKD